jgi:hypothetical protein
VFVIFTLAGTKGTNSAPPKTVPKLKVRGFSGDDRPSKVILRLFNDLEITWRD